MPRVLLTSAAASPAIDVARCLRLDPTVTLVAADADPWGRRMAAGWADQVVTLPRADAHPERFFEALCERAASVDFVFVNLDSEIEVLGELGRALPFLTALAPLETLPVLVDKQRTFEAAALPTDFPATRLVSTVDDLDAALTGLGSPIWLRPRGGTSGQASLRVGSVDQAASWMSFWEGRSPGIEWLAHSYLPGRNLNWSGVFVDGEAVAWASMERLGYVLANVAPSGVTGQVKLCRTIVDPRVGLVAERVIRAIDPVPRGIYSVDLSEDEGGSPKVTEVNPRLAGRPWLYANAGANLPLAALRALRGRPVADAVAAEGLTPDRYLYRQIDVEPVVGGPLQSSRESVEG